MEEYLIFERDFIEIPFDDMAGAKFIVCFDPQDRLGKNTWCVVEVSEIGEYQHAKGLFWTRDEAEIFVRALCEL